MVLSLVQIPTFAASFKDLSGYAWAEAAIDKWAGYGIVQGNENGDFAPGANMTRAEAATVFARLFALGNASASTTFSDVKPSDWYYEAINKCVNAGIMNGVGDGLMAPNAPLTREAFFVMFARGLGLKEQTTTSGPAADGAAWSRGYINALTDKGYVKGMDGKVNATANINRASVMSLLDQTISVYGNKDGETYTGTGTGVMLITAKDCTVTGNIDTLVIAGSKNASSVATVMNPDGSVQAAYVVAADGDAMVRIFDAVIKVLSIVSDSASASIGGSSSVATASLLEQAVGAVLEVLEGAEIEVLTSDAAEAEITNMGVIMQAAFSELAKDSTLIAEVGSYVGVLATSAEGTEVKGDGAVADVIVSAYAEATTKVETAGTTVTTVEENGTTTEETNAGVLPQASAENQEAAQEAASQVSEAKQEAVQQVVADMNNNSSDSGSGSSDNSGSSTPSVPTPSSGGGGGGGAGGGGGGASNIQWADTNVQALVNILNKGNIQNATLSSKVVTIPVSGNATTTVKDLLYSYRQSGLLVAEKSNAAYAKSITLNGGGETLPLSEDDLTQLKTGTESTIRSYVQDNQNRFAPFFVKATPTLAAYLAGEANPDSFNGYYTALAQCTVDKLAGASFTVTATNASNVSATYTVRFT